MGLRPAVKYGLIAAAVLVGMATIKFGLLDTGIIPKVAASASFIPEKSKTDNIVVKDTYTYAYDLPIQPQSGFQGCPRVLSIPWNGTAALNLANGDVTTTPKSLVRQYSGGCLTLERNDDYAVIQGELLKFSQAVAGGNFNSSEGAPFAIIMGDGYPAFIAGLKPQLDKIDQAVDVIGVLGFSHGEDKCMNTPINGDPNNARGALITAVPRDGDQNICIKWAADNNIPINVDNATYDPQAINFVDTTSFTDADDKYIAGYCETREVVNKGIKTGKSQNVCVTGVATWTPGDVTVVEKKGGLITLASTKDYNQQMPTILIANRAWAQKNKTFVVGLLRAVDRANLQIRTTPDGLKKASIVTAAVFGAGGGDEADPTYWAKYFVGFDQTDQAGNKVSLGGSRVVGLAETSAFLGLTPGSYNVYKGVYNTFSEYNIKMYPKEVSSTPKYEHVVDTTYVQAALAGVKISNTAPVSTTRKTITNTVSKQAVSIEFETGSAKITASSQEKLFALADGIAMTSLSVRIDGHTDNTGDSDTNLALSRARAQAVADWLYSQAPETFPKNRMAVRGYGDTDPIADNTSAPGRATNRRVVITLGN